MDHRLSLAALDRSRPIHVDFRKWGGSTHWQLEASFLDEDEHGIWVWGPAGTVVSRPNAADRISPHPFVKLITPQAWWTAMWPGGGMHRVFVDICTPVEWVGNTATLVDLDLDVVQLRSGQVVVEDEDEFTEHQRRFGYPDSLIAAARATTAEMVLTVEGGVEPFGTVAPTRLASVLET